MRYVVSLAAGLGAALLLFLLMHQLIRDADGFHSSLEPSEPVAFVRVEKDEPVVVKPRQPPEPPQPPDELTAPTIEVRNPGEPPRTTIKAEMPGTAVTGAGPYLETGRNRSAAAEGDAVAVVKIEPQWPREAALNGIEGWVEVAFTILPDGSVTDVEVIAAEPPRLFDRNSVRAVRRWKFKPRIVDGQPVARRATQKIVFKLTDQ